MARRRGVPAYVVLHDRRSTHRECAPDDTGSTPRVAGIGDKKLEHYGGELIAMVRAAEG